MGYTHHESKANQVHKQALNKAKVSPPKPDKKTQFTKNIVKISPVYRITRFCNISIEDMDVRVIYVNLILTIDPSIGTLCSTSSCRALHAPLQATTRCFVYAYTSDVFSSKLCLRKSVQTLTGEARKNLLKSTAVEYQASTEPRPHPALNTEEDNQDLSHPSRC